MNNYLIISFYTKDTPYEQVYKDYLQKSLERFDIPNLCFCMDNQHSWLKNTALKPKCILTALESQDKDVVFLDADATIESKPTLFDNIPEEYDIAVHHLDWNSWYGYECGTKELLSGTMYLRNNDKVKLLCNSWLSQSENSNEWEQKVLERLVKQINIKIFELPIEYCCMITRPGGLPRRVEIEPVILHHQVSRELKKKIK